ncbi:MAG: ABC transporter ATP-binding protein [Chitinophagia bacterium]|nr:ABC transporter ATP-binding protein [Chitinophagia bacterium]
MTEILVKASNLAKRYGAKQALAPTTIEIPQGRIVGVIGANGAGKSTLLNCMLGMSDYDGDLTVLGLDPMARRAQLMKDVCFIADVATLPKWARVSDVLDWVEGLHPRFDRAKASARIEKASIPLNGKVKTLSKGMTVQVHLAIALAIDARLLVLDEPTLGLDIVNRRAFYDAILEEFFDETRSVIITTHHVDEIEAMLSHVIFIRDGHVTLDASMESIQDRFLAVDVAEDARQAAEDLKPIYKRSILGRTTYVFDTDHPETLSGLGETRRVGLADLFIALAQPGEP